MQDNHLVGRQESANEEDNDSTQASTRPQQNKQSPRASLALSEEDTDSSAGETRSSSRRVVDKFPGKLHKLLSTADAEGVSHIVSWLPARSDSTSSAFKVHDPKAFVDEIMPLHFNQSKFKSFRRQLNLWSFERIWNGPDKGGYSHPLFVRNKPSLCSKMKRNKIKGSVFPLPRGIGANTSSSSSFPSTLFDRTSDFALQPPHFEGDSSCREGTAASGRPGSALSHTQREFSLPRARLPSRTQILPSSISAPHQASFQPMGMLDLLPPTRRPGHTQSIHAYPTPAPPYKFAEPVARLPAATSMREAPPTIAAAAQGHSSPKGQSSSPSTTPSIFLQVHQNLPSSLPNSARYPWFEAHQANLLQYAEQIVEATDFRPAADDSNSNSSRNDSRGQQQHHYDSSSSA